MKEYDAAIIGGGPAGMTAALYMARFHSSVVLLEKLSPGGQVLITHMIENYPGFPEGIEGWKLADAFAKHLDSYAIDRLSDEVRCIEPGEGAHRIQVGDEWISAKAVIICSGAAYKRLGIPGEKELLGKGVSYCALCDGNFFRNQVVAVVGGGNSALEESLYLAKLVKKLYLIHRRDEFRGQKCILGKCEINPVIEILRSHAVNKVLGEQSVNALLLTDLKTGQEKTLAVDGVFMFVGFEPQAGFLPPALERDGAGFILTDQEMHTNIKGLFAAGDIRSKLCRQIATAVGDGATAANSAYAYLEKQS